MDYQPGQESETLPRSARSGRGGKSTSGTSSLRPGLVRNVTAENWRTIGGAFIEANGGFVIGLAEGECQGVKIPQAPRQWGAWRAYFKRKQISTAFMDAKAKATAESKQTVNSQCFTVPAEWPHLFDADATVSEDHEAGNLFMRNWRPPRPGMAEAAQRAITAAKARRWENNREWPVTESQFRPFPKLWAAFADEQHLLNGHRFEILNEAARSLALFGKESARDVLERRVGS